MKEQKKEKKIKRGVSFTDIMVPAVSGLIFILVLFFILIPSIENSSQALSQIERVKSEQEILERNLSIVEKIDFVGLQKDLSNASKVFPNSLEVAQFAYYIDSLAQEKDLEFRGLRVQDMTSSAREVSVLDVKGIRAPMEYSGEYEPILNFFDELQLSSPYVISFGSKVELNKSGEEGENNVSWFLKIEVTGHYVEEDKDVAGTINMRTPLIPYDSQEDMIVEFSERVKKFID